MPALRPATLLLALLLAASAEADTLSLLGPGSRVPPEGFLIALTLRSDGGELRAPPAPAVTARGAKVLPSGTQGPLHTVLILPEPDAREVFVEATSGELRAEGRFEIGPPAARVELSLSPETPVKGRDEAATLKVRVLTPEGLPDPNSPPPILRANVGTLTALTRTAPGEYSARYELPDTRYPEVAIVVAFAPWPHPESVHGAIGALRIPLATAIELPGYTEARAQMSLEIAGETFGPVKAGQDGRFLLPVVVPPGYRYARGTAVDRVGNRRVSRIDLQLPPTDQLACVLNPQRLPIDGRSAARLLCATSDPYGRPAGNARVSVKVSRGDLTPPKQVEPGLWQWTLTAPKEGGEPLVLDAAWRKAGPSSRESLEIQLIQGPAASLEVTVEEPMAHLGGVLPLQARVLDALGRPRAGATLVAEVPIGTVATTPSDEQGRASATWTLPPEGSTGPASVTLQARGPNGSAPAKLIAFDQAGSVLVGVVDLAGRPVPGERLVFQDRELVTGDRGTVSVGPLAPGTYEVAHAVWSGLRQTLHVLDAEGTIFPEDVAPGSASVRTDVRIAPPLPVNVRLKVERDVVTYWVERPDGTLLADREVAVRVSPGGREELSPEADRRRFRLTSGARSTVTVTDVLTGVTAISEVTP